MTKKRGNDSHHLKWYYLLQSYYKDGLELLKWKLFCIFKLIKLLWLWPNIIVWINKSCLFLLTICGSGGCPVDDIGPWRQTKCIKGWWRNNSYTCGWSIEMRAVGICPSSCIHRRRKSIPQPCITGQCRCFDYSTPSRSSWTLTSNKVHIIFEWAYFEQCCRYLLS